MSAMSPRWRTVAFGQWGHGLSSRRPPSASRTHHGGDAVVVSEHFSPERPVYSVGHSRGGITAMSVAAGHPHPVSRLVLVKASPEGPTADAIERAGHWFESWPRPIRSEEEAAEFFGAAAAPARLAGMERREDGWWPRFDDDITLATWEGPRGGWRGDWVAGRCPAPLVRGEEDWIADDDVSCMEISGHQLSGLTGPGAGHDVHLDAPHPLVGVLGDFLQRAGAPPLTAKR